MIQSIFVVLGLLHFIDNLFDKWDVWDAITKFGSKSKHTFIFKLCFCRFCLLFHIGWVITIVYGAFTSFSWHLMIVPFIVSGLTRLIEKR